MYKVVLRSNLIFFVLVLALAAVAVIYLPQFFPDYVLEVPSIALFAGEIGLSLLLALLVYESASTEQAVGLSFSILGLSMFVGSICNFICQQTQMLPDDFVLISWVELTIMNAAGLLGTFCLFRLEPTEEFRFVTIPAYRTSTAKPKPAEDALRKVAPKSGQPLPEPVEAVPDALKEEDFTPPEESPPIVAKATSGQRSESAKEILEKLDVARINNLEQQLHPAENISIESLFKEENQAARSGKPPSSQAQASAPPAEDHLLPLNKSLAEGATADMVVGQDTAGEVQTVAFNPNNLEEIDKLFGEFDVGVVSVADKGKPASKTVEAPANQLDSKANSQPAVVELISTSGVMKGFARLAPQAVNPDEPVGTMRTIGKMLLDVKAVENIINIGQQMGFSNRNTKAISEEEGTEIDQFLRELDGKQGVLGSLLIGYDGLVVAATIGDGLDSFTLGALSLAIYNHTGAVTKHLNLGKLRQTILQSAQTVAVLTSIPRGVLAVFADSNELGPLSGLLNAISISLEKQVD
jgi:predicted regulator of Ras-like GTPase activity (Roadblock/LC7/MglB family)